MKIFLVSLIGLVVSIFQLAFLSHWTVLGVGVNLILIILVNLIALSRKDEALGWLAITGIILDIFSPVRFGFNIWDLILIYLVISWLMRKYFASPSLTEVIWLIVLASLIFRLPWAIYYANWWSLIFEPIVNLAIGLLVYGLLARIYPSPKARL